MAKFTSAAVGRLMCTACCPTKSFSRSTANNSQRKPKYFSRVLKPFSRDLHAFVVRASAAFGDYPVNDLVGIGDVAGFAVDAVGGVDLELESVFFLNRLVDGGGAEILAGIAVLDGAAIGANI